MSGVLKNAIDLMGFSEFEGKMVGLIGVAGGRMGAEGSLAQLRSIARNLRAWVVPEQASIPQSFQAFNEDGQLVDTELAKRVEGVGQQVARFALLHGAEAAVDYLAACQKAVSNPGA